MEVGELYSSADERNKPIWCHFVHPRKGHRLYSGEGCVEGRMPEGADESRYEPIMGLIHSDESDHAIQASDRLSVAAKIDLSDRLEEDPEFNPLMMDTKQNLMKAHLELAIAITTGFKGVSINGQPLQNTDEHKRIFYNRDPGYVSQCIAFSRNPNNFFADALSGSHTSPPSSDGGRDGSDQESGSGLSETQRDS